MCEDSVTEEDINSITYFWEEKGDLEAWIDWEKRKPIIERERPEIVQAWSDYQLSISTLDAVVKSLNC